MCACEFIFMRITQLVSGTLKEHQNLNLKKKREQNLSE